MADQKQGPAEGQPAASGGLVRNARNGLPNDPGKGVVLAHMNLMRARNLCWLALALLAVGVPLSFAWQGGGLGQSRSQIPRTDTLYSTLRKSERCSKKFADFLRSIEVGRSRTSSLWLVKSCSLRLNEPMRAVEF